MGTVGILANPMSGRDVRRLAARASTTTLEIKRDQVSRAAIGAAAGGAKRLLVVAEPFRISTSAVEHLRLDVEIEVLDVGAELRAADTQRAVARMREAGCGALVVLGGDGTQRAVAKAWRDAPLVPLSTGTNNVFPLHVEATSAGLAAGLVASARVPLADVSRPVKVVNAEIEGEAPDLALIDAALLVGDAVGNFMPFEPARLRQLVLARAEPAAVGMSPIGGLLHPCGDGDEFGVAVMCGAHGDGGRALLAPISPGLFRTVHVLGVRRLALGEAVTVAGPGVLAFDGDRERALAPGQRAVLTRHARRPAPDRRRGRARARRARGRVARPRALARRIRRRVRRRRLLLREGGTVTDLATLANIAEILGGLAIVGRRIFAIVQLREFREQRRQAVAVELVRSFSEPAHANAVNLIQELPDGASAELLRAKGREYERAATMMAITYETIGLLVFREMASFSMVRELTGGLTVVMWRKLGSWVKAVREEQGHRSFAEWFQWLAEQLARESAEKEAHPAHERYADWRPRESTRIDYCVARRQHHLRLRDERDERVARGDPRLPHHRAAADVQRRGLAAQHAALAPRGEEVRLRLERRGARRPRAD